MRRALLVIAKRPQPGQTKTRLSPPLSKEAAAALYECLLRDTLTLALRVPGEVDRFILYAPRDAAAYFREIGPEFALLPQEGNDLGARLDNALAHCLENGFDQVIVMNSDGPTLPVHHLSQAFEQVARADVVLGPSEDGGYYLIGLTQPQPRILREVEMSTPHVLQDTLALSKKEGLTVHLLPPWYDIDTIADLERLWADLAQGKGRAEHTSGFLERQKERNQ